MGSFLYNKGRYSAGSSQVVLVILLTEEEASLLLVHLRIALPKAQQAALLDYDTANFALLLLKTNKQTNARRVGGC